MNTDDADKAQEILDILHDAIALLQSAQLCAMPATARDRLREATSNARDTCDQIIQYVMADEA
jgi:hypothetical protein